MIRVVEDAVPCFLMNKLEHVVTDWDYPWFCLPTASEDDDHFSLTHGVTEKDEHFHLMEDVFLSILSNADVNYTQLLRIRLGMHLKEKTSQINKPHVDRDDHHIGLLLYVNDSDGDTLFYKDTGEIVTRSITPKRNTAVFFNGSLYHSSTTPSKTSRRITINYNFV
jgi:hypothetical protein